jgi:hypothetical protein
MPLSIAAIKNELRPAMVANMTNNDPEKSREDFLTAVANLVANAIKTGVESAVITPVLAAPSGGGPVTGEISIEVQIVP